MDTKIFDISNPDIYEDALNEASLAVSKGGIVVFPTETVYGLGADAFNPSAVKKIFNAKGRPVDNPLIVHLSDYEDIFMVASDITPDVAKVFKAFSPGPISVIVNKNDKIPYEVTAGLDSVAVRIPALKAARDFIKKCGCPIAAPSANLSGKPSPTMPQHVIADMNGKADVILTLGECDVGLESTVVDFTKDTPVIYRPGKITAEEISEIIGKKVNKAYTVNEDEAPKSPGMKYKHYKPNCKVITLTGDINAISDYINGELKKNKKAACIIFNEYKNKIDCENSFYLGSLNDNDTASRLIFAHLRSCDLIGADIVYVTATDNTGIGEAFLNRINRASDEIISL